MAVLPGHCMGHHSYLVRHSEGASNPSVHVGVPCFLLELTIPIVHAGCLLLSGSGRQHRLQQREAYLLVAGCEAILCTALLPRVR